MQDMTIRESLLAMGYTEARPGQWVKPVAFQAFSYVETTGFWTCWFKPVHGGEPEVMERHTFKEDTSHYGPYLRQLKEWEQWAKKDVYTTNSHFELGAIDL